MTSNAPLLERLFPPHPAQEFLSRFWPGQPLVCHGALERLAALSDLPALADVHSLLDAYGEPVMVALPDKRDEHSVIRVEPAAAGALYLSGMTLIFDAVHRYLPAVGEWLGRIQGELGLTVGCEARTIVYASPRDAGNSPHFDANANIVVQLRGNKRWHLAPNPHIENPTERWAINQREVPPVLSRCLEQPFPAQMPPGQPVDLVPGSTLFVPRGHWHSTEASADSLALNFTYSQPTWADIVCAAVHRHLQTDAHWRALADGLGSREPERAAACRAQLAGLLHELQGRVAQLEASEVLALLQPTDHGTA